MGRAMGTIFKIGAATVGKVTSIKPPERSAETIDVTTLASSDGYREYIQGFKDGGEVTVTGIYDSADAGQLALDTAYEAGTVGTFGITFPVALKAAYAFSGIITKLSAPGEANIDDPLGFETTIKVIGKPVLTITT